MVNDRRNTSVVRNTKAIFALIIQSRYEKVDLRDNLPTTLQHDFEELQKYYEVGDWFMFDTIFEVVEASVKAYYLAGKITRDDLDCIFRKYGIA